MRALRPFVLTAALASLISCGSLGPTTDVNAPLVAINAPAAGATVGKTVNIEIGAVDDAAVDKVDVFVDGSLLATLFTPPYRTVWNAAAVATGTVHLIRAEASDVAKNKGTAQIQVTVVTTGQ